MTKKLHLVSQNLKCDWSINFPILKTCSPTSICKEICYARKGRMSMPNSLNRQEAVYQCFKENDPKEIAREIGEGCLRRNLSFLRWCGSGDMFKESCDVVNHLCKDYPSVTQWVVTRKPNTLMHLYGSENLYIMFSLDNSDQSKTRVEAAKNISHCRQYFSYLRTQVDQDTMDASIIFNQQGNDSLPYDKTKCCPVDAGKMKLPGACKRCKKCFSKGVLD